MIYTVKKENICDKKVIVDDMLLTADMPTAAGSKMLEGYMSLLEAEAVTKLKNAGYDICAKVNVGEFAIDVLGETSYFGAEYKDGVLVYPAAEAVKENGCGAAVLDVNGTVRRGAAQSGLVSVKPTYGTVSRYGTVPVACSGETVSVIADSTKNAFELLNVISGHDDKDGTSLADETVKAGRAAVTKKNKVAVLTSMLEGIDEGVKAKMDAAVKALKVGGVEMCEISDDVIKHSRAAWNILMCAELCNNVSRYDGVKYGYRSSSYNNIDELYTNSRTEAFGELLKAAILFGSETLSTENYMKVYDKAMRVRRVISEQFGKLFAEYDAVLMPACSAMSYTEEPVDGDKYISFKENYYTAPASVTGLPAVVSGGVQLVGSAFSEELLASYSQILERAGE